MTQISSSVVGLSVFVYACLYGPLVLLCNAGSLSNITRVLVFCYILLRLGRGR